MPVTENDTSALVAGVVISANRIDFYVTLPSRHLVVAAQHLNLLHRYITDLTQLELKIE